MKHHKSYKTDLAEIKEQLNRTILKGGYYYDLTYDTIADDDKTKCEIELINNCSNIAEFVYHMGSTIEACKIIIKKGLYDFGTPVERLDFVSDAHRLLIDITDDLNKYLSTSNLSLPGSPTIWFIEEYIENTYSKENFNSLSDDALKELKPYIIPYIKVKVELFDDLATWLQNIKRSIELKEIKAIYNKILPQTSFTWIGKEEQLKRLFDAGNEILFKTNLETFCSAFSTEPELIKVPLNIKWIYSLSNNKSQGSKQSLFYFIDVLHHHKLIKDSFYKKTEIMNRKSLNKDIFNRIRFFFCLSNKKLENLNISFIQYKEGDSAYSEIDRLISSIEA